MTDTKTPTREQERFEPFAVKMKAQGQRSTLIELFKSYYGQVLTGHTGMIPESGIEPLRSGEVPETDALSRDDVKAGSNALPQTVLIKLNGGLGTSMGLPHAKSLLKVRDELTFLDITLLQSSGCRGRLQQEVPLVLMNSFSTHEDTLRHLGTHKMQEIDQPLTFLQHKYPKILADSLEPARWPEDLELEWNPPGHGDIYAALVTSGMLDRLLDRGKKYAFVSNIDNLGAVLDLSMLGHFVRNGFPFMMEVARRTHADTKGGHLARLPDGRLILREIAQCPDDDLDSFQDIGRHSYFNTNNIWLDLAKFRKSVEENGLPRLPLIVNPKNLDPRDESSPRVLQLETAMGAAITAFPGAGVIQVPRERFIPVKKTNDLLSVRSDCYIFTDTCELKINPLRHLDDLLIDLDQRFYKKIDQLDARFPFGPPSLVACASLSVQGDVKFGQSVTCRGEVRITNTSTAQLMIADKTVVQGELVLG